VKTGVEPAADEADT